MVRKRFCFTGEVQGVGFRYRAFYAARMYDLTGWVRNEWDGSVLMEVQGENEAISSMLSKLSDSPWIRIENTDSIVIPLKTDEAVFEIR